MKKYLILILTSVIAIASLAQAEMFAVDTRIGFHSLSSSIVWYRNTRIEYNMPFIISGRLVHEVFNGMGLKGELNNYRIGLQGIYGFSFSELSLKPFVGLSMSSSDIVSSSLSVDFGFDASYGLFSWMKATVGAEVLTFSDNYMLDYYAGPSFPLLDWISVDLFGNGLFSNSSNKIGASARVDFKF